MIIKQTMFWKAFINSGFSACYNLSANSTKNSKCHIKTCDIIAVFLPDFLFHNFRISKFAFQFVLLFIDLKKDKI